MLLGFRSQHKVGNIAAYVRQHVDDDGKVTFGGMQESGGITPPGVVEG